MQNDTNNNNKKELDIDKQIFVERPVGKINVGKLIAILSFINIAILFILFVFTGLVCLHTPFNSNDKNINDGFWKLGEKSATGAGISLIVLDSLFLFCALITGIYIWKYKITLGKKNWKKLFWTLILITFLFMIFGISDNGQKPWIYAWDNGKNEYGRSGGWWLILAIYIAVLVYLLVLFLSSVLPHKVKHKISKLVKNDKEKQEENTAPQTTNE